MPPEETNIAEADALSQSESTTPFQKMVSKLESGMKEWEASRFKPEKPAETADTPAPTPPAEPTKEPEKPKEPPQPEEAKSSEPVELDDDNEPIPAIIKSKKAADEFRNLKRTLKSQIKAKELEILGLKKKVDEASQSKTAAPVVPTIDPKDFESVKAERDQLIEQIEKVSLESSPRFKAKFEKAAADIESMAKDAAGEHAEEAIALMKMPPSKARKDRLNQIIADMGPTDQTALVLAFTMMDQNRSEREEAIKNHREYLQQIQAEELTKRAEQDVIAKARREYIVQQALDVAKDFEAFQHREGDAEHNAEADEYKLEVAAFINGEIDDTHSAFLPILAAEGQYLKSKKVPALENKIKELETIITEMKGANPKVEGAKTKESDRETKKAKGFMEAFKENWKGPSLFET